MVTRMLDGEEVVVRLQERGHDSVKHPIHMPVLHTVVEERHQTLTPTLLKADVHPQLVDGEAQAQVARHQGGQDHPGWEEGHRHLVQVEKVERRLCHLIGVVVHLSQTPVHPVQQFLHFRHPRHITPRHQRQINNYPRIHTHNNQLLTHIQHLHQHRSAHPPRSAVRHRRLLHLVGSEHQHHMDKHRLRV